MAVCALLFHTTTALGPAGPATAGVTGAAGAISPSAATAAPASSLILLMRHPPVDVASMCMEAPRESGRQPRHSDLDRRRYRSALPIPPPRHRGRRNGGGGGGGGG